MRRLDANADFRQLQFDEKLRELHFSRSRINDFSLNILYFAGSEDEGVQEASADCLQNIRKLALACEKFRYQHMKA